MVPNLDDLLLGMQYASCLDDYVSTNFNQDMCLMTQHAALEVNSDEVDEAHGCSQGLTRNINYIHECRMWLLWSGELLPSHSWSMSS